MANTYTQLYYHIVFAVKGRQSLIDPKWKVDLYKYITGITTNKNQKILRINGVADHIHILLGTRPDCNLSHIVRDIKSNSSKWINSSGYLRNKFSWQTGFGAFTVGHTQVDMVIKYIQNQEVHHKSQRFREEYIEFLDDNEIEYDDIYLYDFIQ